MNRHRLSVAVVSGSGSTRPYAARWNKAAARLNDTQLAADSAGISGDNRWMNPVFKQTKPLRKIGDWCIPTRPAGASGRSCGPLETAG